jgi:hypothetical protein
MDIEHLVRWLLVSLGLLTGVGLLLVRIDPDRLREKAHTNPGLALYRFRLFRYGVAAAAFIIAAVAFLALPH